MLLIYVLQAGVSYFRNYWAGIAGNRLIFGLRSQLYTHLQRLPHSFFDRHPAGSIVSRVLNDVTQASELINSTLIDVWTDASLLGLVIFALFELNWRLALISLCIAPLWVGFMRHFAPRIKAVSHRMQEAVEVISGEVHERVVGATTVKSFGREDHEVGVFNGRHEVLFDRTIDKVKLASAQEMLIQLLTRCAPAVVVWAGAAMIIKGEMTLGTLMAFFCRCWASCICASLEQLRAAIDCSLGIDRRDRAHLQLPRHQTGDYRPSVGPARSPSSAVRSISRA